MSTIKVSVILPVYNASLYLRECLDSLMEQSLEEIEIICVNDGSTDDSLEILNSYKIKDSRISVISRENSGAGASRNVGIDIAKGEYISFLDADDFFYVDMLKKSYEKCKVNNLDFTVFKSKKYNNNTKKVGNMSNSFRRELLPGEKIFSYKDISENLFCLFVGWAWDKLYKKEFIIENKLKFQEIRSTNDMLFVFSALVCANRIAIIDENLIFHRIDNSKSISNTRDNSWECFYEALKELKNFLIKSGKYEELKKDFINYSLHFSLWHLHTIGDKYEATYHLFKEKIIFELELGDREFSYYFNKKEYLNLKCIKLFNHSTYKKYINIKKYIKQLIRS